MRVSRLASLIAVVTAHTAAIYYFSLGVVAETQPDEDELLTTIGLRVPTTLARVRSPLHEPHERTPENTLKPLPRLLPKHSTAGTSHRTNESTPPAAPQSATLHVDWLAEATRQAQADTSRQIAADDEQARRADALLAPTRPPPGWDQTQQPAKRWSGWSERSKGFEISQGALLFHLNEHCVVGVFIVIPGFACRIGKITPHTGLFEQMHPPVQFGDWKDR